VPEAHYLESWSDARAYDGTASIVQPLIAPLFHGRTAHEVVAVMAGETKSGYELVKGFWTAKATGDANRFWNQSLNDGVVANTAYPLRAMQVNGGAIGGVAPSQPASGVELIFRHDPTLYDGRFANNGWLQELPKPTTKIAWDNVAHMSVATAQRLGVANEDVVRIEYRGKAIDMPIWMTPGHADESVTLHFGSGRRAVGRVGNGAGFDVYPLRTSDAPSFGGGAVLTRVGKRYPIACTQGHFSMEGRDLVRSGSLDTFVANPRFARNEADDDRRMNLLHGWEYKGNAWGMVVDTSACVGCGGCVVACVAENNISVVGKKEVKRGREMHWLRIDRYYEGNPANPVSYHQPVMCQHCENAPCESVCPVEATTHSPEGINEMTYNRCIGTRYCSNNCPYKVRRFNFFAYADFDTPTYKMQRNPDVTTRSRGVMEKCTFCVQRVNRARIEAEKDNNRPIRDGEIVTACQAACPAEAIVFGNINDKASKVAALKAEPHNYKLVGEINTQPRVTYLATIRNPNPDIKAV
jgi:molybdopterin-containing oxidoreductase family iron-sulfur binding subunit